MDIRRDEISIFGISKGDKMSAEYISFHPVPKDRSLIGFVSFKYGKEYSFYELGVHKLLKPKGRIKIRLVYPEKQAPNKDMQEELDAEINAYLLANYKEVIDKAYKDNR